MAKPTELPAYKRAVARMKKRLRTAKKPVVRDQAALARKATAKRRAAQVEAMKKPKKKSPGFFSQEIPEGKVSQMKKRVAPKKKLTQRADKNNIILKRQLAEDARKKIVASQRLKSKVAPKPNKPKTAPEPKVAPKVTSKVVPKVTKVAFKPKVTSKVAPKVTSKVAPSLDKLSFSKAFNKSRDEHGGPGGVFTWRGKEYQTNIKGEAYVKNPKSVWKTKPSVKGGRGFERENLGERAEAKSLQTEVNKAWETIKNMKTGGKVTNPARIKSTIRMTSGGGVGSKLIDDIYNA